ncbi:hypothetical protein Xcel_0215 [Xylanimonas cellulosilytica DSM 15894]|uniref:Uncharacterized protein n=1 Tax=Xylanimonas cellulosilytica (strain DSM 15894 / JCM 12276 / CECT 5975 / KCTC 9989 / LMG 20990 / NBRC 107835 / XIL07) TaxID=446471 RepID=D1BUL3_XYLCX|nr:hypothetical protein [Xylanimonas cellulosilytica]ACZ29254.1 hypothetical protein Xcel_0215 [Xylanimonas cellulosilytica DSM 15894]
MSSADARHGRRARQVTYGMVAVLVAAAIAHVELWPLTSFRLFSSVRTGTGTAYELLAVGADGTRTPVPARIQLLAGLAEEAPDDVAAQVGAWLDDAGLDPAAVDVVVLERATWQLDPDTLARHETARDVVLEVRP